MEDTVKLWLCGNMPGPVLSVCCILFYVTFLSTPQIISLQYDSRSKKTMKIKGTLKKKVMRNIFVKNERHLREPGIF